jgi:hypothetical protein
VPFDVRLSLRGEKSFPANMREEYERQWMRSTIRNRGMSRWTMQRCIAGIAEMM